MFSILLRCKSSQLCKVLKFYLSKVSALSDSKKEKIKKDIKTNCLINLMLLYLILQLFIIKPYIKLSLIEYSFNVELLCSIFFFLFLSCKIDK
jgi:hypothetical protein